MLTFYQENEASMGKSWLGLKTELLQGLGKDLSILNI